jgi:hypothetical protein
VGKRCSLEPTPTAKPRLPKPTCATATRSGAWTAALSGELSEAEGVEAVRAVLSRLFKSFTIKRAEDGPNANAIDAGDYLILSEARPEALYPLPPNWQPVFKRVPLEMAEDFLNVGLPM